MPCPARESITSSDKRTLDVCIDNGTIIIRERLAYMANGHKRHTWEAHVVEMSAEEFKALSKAVRKVKVDSNG